MRNSRGVVLLVYLFSCFLAWSQSEEQYIFPTREQLAGSYYPYHPEQTSCTNPPEGYKPFYINHYGRHGSRWLLSDAEYTWIVDLFKKAHENVGLTPLGENVYQRLIWIYDDARGRCGNLTPLGAEQHMKIAERTMINYPGVFHPSAKIQCNSTDKIRCILSMAAFSKQLAALNSSLKINMEANERDMFYMNALASYNNYHNPVFSALKKDTAFSKIGAAFTTAILKPERLISSLFKDGIKCTLIKEPLDLMTGLYAIASDLSNTTINVRLDDLFMPDECYAIWQSENYKDYLLLGPSPRNKGIPANCVKPLLADFIKTSKEAIRDGEPAANFRFGHDTNILAFSALMQLEGCSVQETDPLKLSKKWKTYEIIPMAANIQWIFYRKEGSDDILVRFLLNEKETAIPLESNLKPYYLWKDVEAYYCSVLDE